MIGRRDFPLITLTVFATWAASCARPAKELETMVPPGTRDGSATRLADAAVAEAPDGGPQGTHTAITLAAPRDHELGAFATSGTCATCHSNAPSADAMRDDSDREIAPYELWQSSMMANAARDPLYRAVLSAELAATPSAAQAITDKCLGCHAPMAARSVEQLKLSDLYEDTAVAQMALDGVSCTVCHQIAPDGLGEATSFSGHFTVNEAREMFGPHAQPFSMPMMRFTGYTPTEGAHIQDSALCGSCHTLYTDALDANGAEVGARLAEQTPFLEWRNSEYPAQGASCQSCHLPTVDQDGRSISTRIARNPGGMDFGPIDDRAPYGRHVLVGGNTLVPALLRDADDLNPRAPRAAFDATIAEARRQLASAATLTVRLARSGDTLEANVQIENRTGHKLPTAHPIRRMWLRVRVYDKDGATVMASGEVDAALRMVGADGAPLPFELAEGPVAPHVDRVTDADHPAIFEAVMGDAAGAPTTLLLRGTRFIKDNRLLPRGWRADGPHITDISPAGIGEDPSFGAGGDTVTYVTSAPSARGPYRVQAELLYTPLSPRWYAELVRYDTREVADFVRRYSDLAPAPETMATAEASE